MLQITSNEPSKTSVILQDLIKYLKSSNWLHSNNLFSESFVNSLMLLVLSIETKATNTDMDIDVNTKSITLILYVPWYYRLYFKFGICRFLFSPFVNPKLQEVINILVQIFPHWKIFISIA